MARVLPLSSLRYLRAGIFFTYSFCTQGLRSHSQGSFIFNSVNYPTNHEMRGTTGLAFCDALDRKQGGRFAVSKQSCDEGRDTIGPVRGEERASDWVQRRSSKRRVAPLIA